MASQVRGTISATLSRPFRSRRNRARSCFSKDWLKGIAFDAVREESLPLPQASDQSTRRIRRVDSAFSTQAVAVGASPGELCPRRVRTSELGNMRHGRARSSTRVRSGPSSYTAEQIEVLDLHTVARSVRALCPKAHPRRIAKEAAPSFSMSSPYPAVNCRAQSFPHTNTRLPRRKPDDHRTRFRALAKALPSAFDDRFDRPYAEP